LHYYKEHYFIATGDAKYTHVGAHGKQSDGGTFSSSTEHVYYMLTTSIFQMQNQFHVYANLFMFISAEIEQTLQWDTE
jgi:hypothetical protein